MGNQLNRLIDKLSDFLAARKGLLPIVGVLLVMINFFIGIVPGAGWIAQSNLLLHLGVIIAILGIMIAWAL